MTARRLVVVGAGGFARELRWLAREVDRAGGARLDFVGFVVSDLAQLGPHDERDSVRGDLGWLAAHRSSFDAVAIGVGTPAARLRLGQTLSAELGLDRMISLVHPSVQADFDTAKLEPGTIVCANSVLTVNVTLEAFSMVNLACTIGHETRVGRGSVLNPSVNLSGGVSVGAGVLIGTGAQVLQYLEVGDGATVGAGAVVTKNVLPGQTVVGIPAKPMKVS